MLKAMCQSNGSLTAEIEAFDPPLVTREDHYTLRDYLRPMAGGMAYGLIVSTLVSLPLLFVGAYWGILVALGITAVLAFEMAAMMALSAFIHHRVFVHRLRKYGPSFYSSELSLDTPPAEAFELCLAATTELPKSKIVGMDEEKGTIKVAVKGNFWITVDRQVTLRVRAAEGESGKATISVDPSIKLTPFRRKFIRMIWGDKWYPLIFRSDVSWNRKIINSINEYITSVPNWDHRHDPQELIESAFREKVAEPSGEDAPVRSDAA